MSIKTVELWVCDLCHVEAPEGAEGWTNATYIHGCPEHGELVAAHQATVHSHTTGRGRRERDFWRVTCSCSGWLSAWERDSSRNGKQAHKTHLREEWRRDD